MEDLRLVWIKNTLELECLFASQAFLEEVKANPRLEVLVKLLNLPFGLNENLGPRWKS